MSRRNTSIEPESICELFSSEEFDEVENVQKMPQGCLKLRAESQTESKDFKRGCSSMSAEYFTSLSVGLRLIRAL